MRRRLYEVVRMGEVEMVHKISYAYNGFGSWVSEVLLSER